MDITSTSIFEQTEYELSEIANSQNYTLNIISRIEQHLDSCILSKNYSTITDIFSLCKDSHFHSNAESRRYYLISKIVIQESTVHDPFSFFNGVRNHADAASKYVNCTLVLRRLSFAFPTNVISDSIDFLQTSNISPHAIITILSNELFEGIDELLPLIFNIMNPVWNKMQNINFLMHIAECFPTEINCLNTASACIELGEIALAYEYLSKISSPSIQILDLKSSLYGVLYGNE